MKAYRQQFIGNFARMRILSRTCLLILTSFVLMNEARFINIQNHITEPQPLVKLKSQPMLENREERKKFVDQMFNKASFQKF